MDKSLEKLELWCRKNDFKGYDPYDTLNSYIPFKLFGNYISAIAIQIQKRNPINIRPLLGVKKEHNPKAMGLFLKSYCILYKKTKNEKYLKHADTIFDWLINNYSKGYSGMAWGYNFDWATPKNYLKAYTPSTVVTSFVIDGIFEYYKITKSENALKAINSSKDYIVNDIPVLKLEQGISFSYTHLSTGACYNASLLAAEVLARYDNVNNTKVFKDQVKLAINFVLSKQKTDGSWLYSYNEKNNTERHQIDFHQGFVLVSLHNLNELYQFEESDINASIKKGLEFYRNNQFLQNGRSLWRLPKKWPVEIHNQSQGIITFISLEKYNQDYKKFAQVIFNWTIENMYNSKRGYFHYRKTQLYNNKIPFIRWSQAWMLLATATILDINE